MVEKAKSASPDNSVYVTEYGNQQVFLGNIKAAQTAFKTAMKLDDNSESALNGLIKIQLTEGDYENAEKQIDFLNEIQASGSLHMHLELT
jgi:Flp pilus assembly protein TadD